MGKIESFPSEALLMDRIESHLSEGMEEAQMTIIANSELEMTKSKYGNIRNEAKAVGPWDKFVSVMAMKSREEKQIDNLNLNEHDKYVYRKALEDNQIVLYIV